MKDWKINTCNPTKDSFEYMCIQCNKTEWIREALNLNLFNNEQFIWIDFGIFHILKDFPQKFKTYEKVRIPSIWNLNMYYRSDIYKDISWYFAGGVFGGNKESLIKFADLMKEECLNLLNKKNHLMWEVNIWYLIWKNNKELFSDYKCNHNQTIINNY